MSLGMIEATTLTGQMRKVRLKEEDWKAQLFCSGCSVVTEQDTSWV